MPLVFWATIEKTYLLGDISPTSTATVIQNAYRMYVRDKSCLKQRSKLAISVDKRQSKLAISMDEWQSQNAILDELQSQHAISREKFEKQLIGFELELETFVFTRKMAHAMKDLHDGHDFVNSVSGSHWFPYLDNG
jgi:hypothetical protein